MNHCASYAYTKALIWEEGSVEYFKGALVVDAAGSLYPWDGGGGVVPVIFEQSRFFFKQLNFEDLFFEFG